MYFNSSLSSAPTPDFKTTLIDVRSVSHSATDQPVMHCENAFKWEDKF